MDYSSAQFWTECKKSLADSIPTQPFNTWILPIELISVTESEDHPTLTLGVRDDFHREWLDQHYGRLVASAVAEISGFRPEITYKIVGPSKEDSELDLFSPAPPAEQSTDTDSPASKNSSVESQNASDRAEAPGTGYSSYTRESVSGPLPKTLNTRYTFDTFIEADCNRLARSAGLAVAERPGATSFNPFLVYGKVGLGKTHLAHAIGNQIQEAFPRANVLYLTSEAFTNFFVQAVKRKTLSDFTETIRQVDVLIVDDIQFFGGKEKTQEQFFQLFNDLHQRGKQIILCADRSPAEIDGIEDRLLSRFRWGLSADVQPPDLETRIAILQNHAKRVALDLPFDVVDFIAYNVKDNIRLLEGAVNRLLALSRISNRTVDLALAQEALHEIIDGRIRKTVTAEGIRELVAESFDIEQELLIGKSRKRPIVDARQVAMFFCKQLTQLSLEAIGKRFGGRDHSTVIHACRAVQARLDTDPAFKKHMVQIAQRLQTRLPD